MRVSQVIYRSGFEPVHRRFNGIFGLVFQCYANQNYRDGSRGHADTSD